MSHGLDFYSGNEIIYFLFFPPFLHKSGMYHMLFCNCAFSLCDMFRSITHDIKEEEEVMGENRARKNQISSN